MRRGAVAAKLFWTGNVAVTGRQESLAAAPGIFPLCSANSHPAMQAVGLAVLIRSADPVAQYLVAKMLEVHFPLPGRSRETRPVHLVHHRDEPTSTANRLVSGDLLHFESLKRNRNVVLSDVVRGNSLERLLSTFYVYPAGNYFGMSPWSWGLVQGLHRCT